MNGATVGFGGEYDIKDVPHAMRLSNSGTFIHGNYWAASGTFGIDERQPRLRRPARRPRRRRQQGTPAAWFFDSSIIGDVVVVKNSNDKHRSPRTTASTAGTCPGRSGPGSDAAA